jgi:hypothetical protein
MGLPGRSTRSYIRRDNQQYERIRATWREARKALKYEYRFMRRLQMATDLKSEFSAIEEERYEDDCPPLQYLDPGVAATVLTLSAMGCFTVTSCNGGCFGHQHHEEHPLVYLDPETPGRCAQGYLWTALVPGKCVVYEWHASRAAACLDSLLGKDFKGKLQCDGYSAYPAFAKDKEGTPEQPGVRLFGCWAHARRGFFEAQEQAPRVAGWILHQIGILYGGKRTCGRAGRVRGHGRRYAPRTAGWS